LLAVAKRGVDKTNFGHRESFNACLYSHNGTSYSWPTQQSR
jgi:hypothetical protein